MISILDIIHFLGKTVQDNLRHYTKYFIIKDSIKQDIIRLQYINTYFRVEKLF
jgi:hypothetical protein